MVTVSDQCREAGNKLFAAGDFRAAIAQYSRAIQHDSVNSKLFSNRALCFLKLHEWQSSLEDAERVVELDAASAKGYYIKGKSQLRLGSTENAVRSLTRGYELTCLQRSTPMFHQLFNALYHAKQQRYEATASEQETGLRLSADQCKGVLAEVAALPRGAAISDEQRRRIAEGLGVVELLYQEVRNRNPQDLSTVKSLPDCFVCPISLSIMHDPVLIATSSDGMSFERETITEHFRVRGPVDPISLAPLQVVRKGDKLPPLIPNVALRNAIESFLEAHPWLFTDSCM
jgi:tetratricopeptide (TPR) repeat protein